MDLDFEIPYKVCLNPPRMEERRRTVSEMFRMHRLRVIRWPSRENGGRRHSRGFANAGLRENYLTFLLAVRKARALGRKALLFLEDDVILHDQFRERTADLEVPSDWGLLYFGCLHMERPPNMYRRWMKRSRFIHFLNHRRPGRRAGPTPATLPCPAYLCPSLLDSRFETPARASHRPSCWDGRKRGRCSR